MFGILKVKTEKWWNRIAAGMVVVRHGKGKTGSLEIAPPLNVDMRIRRHTITTGELKNCPAMFTI